MPKGIPGRSTCSLSNCSDPVKGQGLCLVHYWRHKRGSDDITQPRKRGRKRKGE